MGRPKKNPTLEEKIKAAEQKVIKYGIPYNKALDELKALNDQRQEAREENLLKAVKKSRRTYDEIMRFIQSNPDDEDEWY